MGSTTSSSTKYKTAHLLGAVIIAFLVGVFLSWAANSALSSSEASLTSSEGGKSPSKPEDRVLISDMLLPTSAIPEKYDLWMKLYLPGYGATVTQSKNLTYDANVVISLEVKKTLKSITLNSVGHSFDKEGSFLEMEDGKMRIVEIIKQDKAEKVEFVLEKAVHKGDVKLHVKYSGAILTGLDGLYQTKYTSADGTPRIAAVTQMEPMDARKMVPCFDEPAHKAEWEVTIVHPKGTSALANGIELGEPKEIEEGFLETKFKETPKMSSYLLAIFVSEFKFVEKETSSGVRFRIWSRPEAIQTAEYALAAGVKCLEGFEKFYDYKYPLEKQDMVALPDFAAGAMENWGLITYREKDLLYDAEVYYYPEKMRVTQVIAHELAHQWFGNLVTMKWWDDIWLNEGFAAFVQNIGMDIIADGAFKMETDFVGNQQKQAMEMDATAASHPIVFPTTYKNEINELFDNISYRKGASLLSMIRRIMGEEDFNQGLKNYLKKYAYKNAEHGNLFHEWDQTVSVVGPNGRRMNVTDFALKWTRQMGYPYLTLERVNGTAVKVVQRRYKVDLNAKEIEKFSVAPYGYKWDVPVWIQRGENQKTELHWLPAHGDLLLPARKGESLLINADSYAIARTHYSNQEWRNIIRRLESNPETFSVRSRYRIVSDVFAMAEIGNVEYSLALELVNYIRKEKEFHVWQAFLLQIDTIRAYFGTSPEIVAVEDFMKVFITPVAKNVDVASAIAKMTDDTTYMQNRVDVLIFEQHCRVNPAECREIFATYRTTQFEALCGDHGVSSECSKVPSAVRSSVYCTSVKEGDDAFFKKIVGFYQRETMQLEKERLMKALGCTRNPVNVKWLLGNILDRNSSVFRTQDLGKVANHVAENPIGSEIVLGYLFSNWDSLEKNYGDANFVFKTLVKEFTSQVRDRYALNQLKTFMENTPGTKKYSAYRAQLQAAEQRIEWLEKNGAIVVKTFKEHTRKLEESV